MLINDLAYLETADDIDVGLRGASSVFTGASTITVVEYGVAIAEAEGFAFGEDTLTNAHATTSVAKDESSTNFLTKSAFYGEAEAAAQAISVDGSSVGVNSSYSYSEYDSKSYQVVSG